MTPSKLSAEQIQSAIDRAQISVTNLAGHADCPQDSFDADCKFRLQLEDAQALLDVYGRLQEADQDRLLRIFDQHAVECGNCGCALIARGGSLGEHYGLTAKDPGSEDEQLCGYCAGLELADASAKLRDLGIANDQLITDETVLRAELTEARKEIPDPMWLLAVEQQKTDLDEARRQLDVARKAPCAPDCASRKAVCADCYRPTGMLGACHGFGEVVNGKVLEGAQYSSHLFPHPCNCWKSQITPTETQS